MIFEDTTTNIGGIRVPLRAIRFHSPGPPVHRLDRRQWFTPREKVLLLALAFVIACVVIG